MQVKMAAVHPSETNDNNEPAEEQPISNQPQSFQFTQQHFNANSQQLLEGLKRDSGCCSKNEEIVNRIIEEGGKVYAWNENILGSYGDPSVNTLEGILLQDEHITYQGQPMVYSQTIVVSKDKTKEDIKTAKDTIKMFKAGALYLTNKRLIISSITSDTDTIVSKQPRKKWYRHVETYVQDKIQTQKLTMTIDPHQEDIILKTEGEQYTIQSWKFNTFHFFGIPLRNIIHTEVESLSGSFGEGNVWEDNCCSCCSCCCPCWVQINNDLIFTQSVNNRILKIGVLFPPWEEKRNVFVVLDEKLPLINVKTFVGLLASQTEGNRIEKYDKVVLNLNEK